MIMYTCFDCGISKSIEEYYYEYSKRGHTRLCKDCIKQRRKGYTVYPLTESGKIKHALKQREYVEKNITIVRERQKQEYYKHQEERIERVRQYRIDNPDKEYAHGCIRNALKFGKIKRPSICSKCGKECKPAGHHPDYSKPLEVVWLCRKCHSLHHRGILAEDRL
jgi:hypothetical protein